MCWDTAGGLSEDPTPTQQQIPSTGSILHSLFRDEVKDLQPDY